MHSQLKSIRAELNKGKCSSKVSNVVEELQYLTEFNSSISQAMAKTVEHLSDSVFVTVANSTLARRDAYLSHLKAGIKPDTLASLRTAPLIWDTVVRAREARARPHTTPRDRPRGSSPTNDNQFVVTPVQGLLPGSLQTVKRVQFTQSLKCTNKTIDFQTRNSLSVNLNVVKHVLFVKGQSQKKDVSPVIVTPCQEKLKSVKNASFVTRLVYNL